MFVLGVRGVVQKSFKGEPFSKVFGRGARWRWDLGGLSHPPHRPGLRIPRSGGIILFASRYPTSPSDACSLAYHSIVWTRSRSIDWSLGRRKGHEKKKEEEDRRNAQGRRGQQEEEEDKRNPKYGAYNSKRGKYFDTGRAFAMCIICIYNMYNVCIWYVYKMYIICI